MVKKMGGLFLLFGLLLLAGCSEGSALDLLPKGIEDVIVERYELVDTVQSSVDQNEVSRVFRASGQSVDEIRDELTAEVRPNEIGSKVEGKQALIYDRHFVILSEDDEQPDDTVIELADAGFVRDNFHPSFFDGMFAMWLLDEVFDVDDWGKRQRSRCIGSTNDCYGGYTISGRGYKGPAKVPDFRGSSIRGGGPGSGK